MDWDSKTTGFLHSSQPQMVPHYAVQYSIVIYIDFPWGCVYLKAALLNYTIHEVSSIILSNLGTWIEVNKSCVRNPEELVQLLYKLSYSACLTACIMCLY